MCLVSRRFPIAVPCTRLGMANARGLSPELILHRLAVSGPIALAVATYGLVIGFEYRQPYGLRGVPSEG